MDSATTRYAIIADIHANIDALTAVCDSIAGQNVQKVLCLGDIIGYNAAPCECLDVVMKRGFLCISGNHERFLMGATQVDHSVRKDTLAVIEWTKKRLSPEQMEFTAGLKKRQFIDDKYLIAHGSPRHEDEYILTTQLMRDNIMYLMNNFLGIGICFVGHTHMPLLVARGKLETNLHEDKTIALADDKVYLINPGSVGQPRDGLPKASYVVFDSSEGTVAFKRVEYDVAAAQKRVREAGFEERFAARLALGK
jgi:predicted phosphodiesterase